METKKVTARQIAQELYRLMKSENPYTGEELLSAASVCERLDVSRSWFDRRAERLPRVKVGGTYRYAWNKVVNELMRQ